MPDVTGEKSTADLSGDLVCLIPQILLQLPSPVSLSVPGIAHNSGSPGRQGSVVASTAVPPCNIKGWAPHHQRNAIRVQLITSQGIPALWKKLNSEVSFTFENPLISLLLDSVQSLSCVQLFVTPWTAACQASLSITNSRSLLKLMSIESVMPSNHLILCCPLLLPPSVFSTSGSFPMSQFFTSHGQSIGVSASVSVLPMNIQDWSPLGWTGWISLLSKWLSRVFSNTTLQKHQFFGTQLSL